MKKKVERLDLTLASMQCRCLHRNRSPDSGRASVDVGLANPVVGYAKDRSGGRPM